MSMLAERKGKQKWSDDPNGLRWAKDDNAFGRKMLEKMGWQGGGLGKLEDGKQEFVRISVKNDALGVGYTEKTDRQHLVKVSGGLNDVLASLRTDSAETGEQPKPESTSFSLVEASKGRGTRFHYRRMVEAKDVKSRINEVIITDSHVPALSKGIYTKTKPALNIVPESESISSGEDNNDSVEKKSKKKRKAKPSEDLPNNEELLERNNESSETKSKKKKKRSSEDC